MLTLTRKMGETVMIGDDIEITVLNKGCPPGRVKLVFKVPHGQKIFRKELYDKIQEQQALEASVEKWLDLIHQEDRKK